MMLRLRLARLVRAASPALVVLAVWEVLALAGQSKTSVFPPPSTIVVTLLANWQTFASDLQPTLMEATLGFLIATAVALTLASIFVRSAAIEQSLYNVAVTMHSIPLIAVVPILVIWFGNGSTPKIAVAALASFFPILVNATRGLRSIDQQSTELMHVLDASWWQVFAKLRWPSALPYLFAAFKIGAPSAVLGAIIGEWIGSQTGIGYRILTAMFNFDVNLLWATMVVSALAALAGFTLFAVLERLTIGRWERSA